MKQAPQLVAVQLRELVRDMRRRAQALRTAAERIAMIRDVAIFCVAFHTTKRGFELSVAVASQVWQMSGGEGFISNFLFGKTLQNSSHAVVVKKNQDCPEICAVATMVEYQQAAESMQWSVAKGSGLLFPSVLKGEKKGYVALTAVQMTTSLHAQCVRLAWNTSGTRCTPSEWEGRRAITWTIRPWTFFGNMWGGSQPPSHADT